MTRGITSSEAQDALTLWNISGNYLSVLAIGEETWNVRLWHSERFLQNFSDAARKLGYTLTPIVTPSPDSGRAKEIGDVEPNPAEIAGLFFDHRN